MFTVVIPSRTASNLIPCIEAVRACEPTCHIVIIDDGVGDQGLDQAAFFEPISVIPGRKPFNHSTACNQGIRGALECGHSGILLLNDDALLESPGGFALLAQCCEQDQNIGCIGATTNLTGQPLQIRQAEEDVLDYNTKHAVVKWRVPNKAFGLRFVPHIAFICVYIPKTTIGRIGMLDERYCLDYGVNDRDYCMACERAGLRVAVHDAVYVDHSKLKSSYRGEPEAPRSFQQNYTLYKAKWGVTE